MLFPPTLAIFSTIVRLKIVYYTRQPLPWNSIYISMNMLANNEYSLEKVLMYVHSCCCCSGWNLPCTCICAIARIIHCKIDFVAITKTICCMISSHAIMTLQLWLHACALHSANSHRCTFTLSTAVVHV